MPDIIPLIVGLIVFASSLISLSLGLSVTIIEIALGTFAGGLGLKADEWMIYMAGFGGIVLTFLAGAEVENFSTGMLDNGQGFFVVERSLFQPVGGDIHDAFEAPHAKLLINNTLMHVHDVPLTRTTRPLTLSRPSA